MGTVRKFYHIPHNIPLILDYTGELPYPCLYVVIPHIVSMQGYSLDHSRFPIPSYRSFYGRPRT